MRPEYITATPRVDTPHCQQFFEIVPVFVTFPNGETVMLYEAVVGTVWEDTATGLLRHDVESDALLEDEDAVETYIGETSDNNIAVASICGIRANPDSENRAALIRAYYEKSQNERYNELHKRYHGVAKYHSVR